MLALSRTLLLFATSLLPVSASAAPISCTQPGTEPTVRMVFGGDLVLGNNFLVDDIPASWDDQYFAGVREYVRNADIAVANLEGVLGEHGESTKNPSGGLQFAFRFPSRYAALLKREGFDVLNIANNHAYDFGDAGLRDTQGNLAEAGIAFVGPRGQSARFEIRGLHVTLLGYAYSPHFASIFEMAQDAEEVRQAKARGDIVVVTFHGGAEGPAAIWHEDAEETFLGENRGNVVAFARAMVDAGADLVVGHGPHVLRAVECYKDKPISYSLGNFVGVGGLSTRKMAAITALLQVDVDSAGLVRELELIPLRFDDRKLPQADTREYGKRLVNHLGRHARFKGSFVEFPVDPEEQGRFERWLRNAAH